MESTTALLRIAARVAGASVVLVARTDESEPLAAWGCDPNAAAALLRAVRHAFPLGAWSFRRIALVLGDATAGELIFIAPSSDLDGPALVALAAEIAKLCDPAGSMTREVSALERLTESVEQFGEAISIMGTPLAQDASSSVFLHVNAGFGTLFGYSQADLVGQPADLLWGPLTDTRQMTWIRSRIVESEAVRAAGVLYHKDGTPIWIELASTPIRHDNRDAHHVVTYRDVTSRKQFVDALAAEQNKLQTTLAAIADAVVTVLSDGRVEFVNEAAQKLLGVDLVDAYGQEVGDVIRLLDGDGKAIDIVGRAAENGVYRGRGHIPTKSGPVDVAFVASWIADEHGTVVVLRDVTAENTLAKRLSFEALHDPLTGLQNRRAFFELLDGAVRGARERGEVHAVAFLDLDRFKVVNDQFGHATGDRLLREIGPIMGRVVRGGDVLARIGGDEFGLLLTNCRIDDARHVADKVRAAVEEYRIEHEGQYLSSGVCIGLAPIGATTRSAAEVIAAADAACYQAKAAGRNAIVG
jgi:diguanylate cyclase (GGDEF)-like protein/PAS domain S-box-containing protein